MQDALSYKKGPMLCCDPIQSSMLITKEERSVAELSGILTLFKEFRHDVLVMVGCFYFFCDMRSGIFQVFCNATKFWS